ncbi:MAG TPA: ABC transporter substrate-binding protein [Trueperaceae bacterium]
MFSPAARAAPTRLLLLGFLLTTAWSAAQTPLRIGVVLPYQDTATSANWNEYLAARAWERDVADQAAGLPVELFYRDGGTTPANTLPAIRELVEQEDVHAVVCCVTAVSAGSAAAMAARLPILSLEEPLGGSEDGPLVMVPGRLTVALAMAQDARRFGRGVGLMTLDNGFGREIVDAVVAALAETGLPLSRAEQYPPGADVLTPEALLVAASEPSAVIVWGLPDDSATAIRGLRARGYEGPVYLPWSLANEFPGGVRNSLLREALLATPPVVLAEELPPGSPNHEALERLREVLARAYGVYGPTLEGALAFDALELLLSAAELATVYGVSPADTASFRQAVSDALVAMGPVDGAAGSYDYDGEDPDLTIPRGVVIATPAPRGLVPAH